MKRSLLLLTILLCTQLLGYAQDSIEGKTIYKIKLKGLKREKKRDVLATMMTREGMIIDINLLEQDYQNLMAMNSFEDVIITSEEAKDERSGVNIPDMLNIVIEFIEKATIRKIIFKGNENIGFGFLKGDIITKSGDFVNKANIVGDISKLEEKYQEKGFNYVKVDYELYTNEELKRKNQIDLIFNIVEGTETYVREIKILGNNRFSEFTLKNKMKTKERKFLGLQKGTFIESTFYQDLEEIKKFYRDQGHFRVDILQPEINRYEIEEDKEKKEVIHISIQIEEGIQYYFDGLELVGNKVFDNDDLIFPLKLKKGQVFNYSKFQEDLFIIQKRYNDYGYVETRYSDEMKIDDEKKLIKVKLTITESKRSYIEAVFFRGNTKTKNYVLHRSVATKVGDIFDYSKLMSSYFGLQNLGFFTKIEWDIQPGSAPGLLKIIYLLEEGSSAEIRFGLQISTTKWPPEFTLFGELGEKNFLGRQMVMRGKIEVSMYRQGIEYNFDDPWFLNFPWSIGGSVKFYHKWINKVLVNLDDDVSKENELRKEANDKAGNKDEINDNYLKSAYGQWTTMGIHEISYELGARTGYRFLRFFSVFLNYSLTPTYTFMAILPNEENYRYWKELVDSIEIQEIRQAIIHEWGVRSKMSATFAISTVKRAINPVDGLKFSVTAGYTWGHYDSVHLGTKFTYYLKLLEMNFDKWNFHNVLVFNFGANFLFPGFRNLGGELYPGHAIDPYPTQNRGPIVYRGDYQFVDGVFVGRGWGTSLGAAGGERLIGLTGYARLDFSIEYRVPIHEQFVWLAAFVDMVNLIRGPVWTKEIDRNTQKSYSTAWQWWNQPNFMGWENWYGSVGVGVQLTIPQLPLSFYVVKRFKVNYLTGIEWVGDSPNTGNLDFVLSIVGAYF